ncbi:MAG: TetR/AcrR family transcriptional regulator [Rubrivivax sp.]|jgi:AcrR family transcriptional regulator|nr:TetR/AcrR family transcriptional regulator [Rubrivivax sp.]
MPQNVAPIAVAPAAGLPAPGAASRQRRKQARPQELLDAALELFVERGFAAARSEEVARRAGVSKGTLYLYYPSKQDLFKAVVRHNLVNLIAEGRELVAAFAGPTSELLGLLVQTWWQRVGSTAASGIHKIVIAEARNFPDLAQFYTDEVILPADQLFSSAVQRGIDRGEFRPVPVHEVAYGLMAPMIFLCLHRHSFGACPVRGADVDPAAVLRTQLDLVLRGLEARRPVEAP